MPRKITRNEIGGTTLASTYQKIHAIQSREWAAGARIDRFYDALTQSHRRVLEDAFFRYFVYPLDSQPRWDAVSALRSDVAATVNDRYIAATDDILDETELTSDDELDESFLQGWYFGLWDIYQAGGDVDIAVPPTSEAIEAAIAGAAIGGLSLMERARRWIGDSRLKHSTGVRAVILSEETLPGTLQWYDGIASVLTNRVSSLVVGEIHRAFELGQASAVGLFPDMLLGEVWVTREDAQVCPRCQALHLTVTDLKPIVDSHPNCRCFKVPIVDGAGSRPIDFTLFMQELQL